MKSKPLNEEEFKKLIKKASKIHEFTFCVKLQKSISTRELCKMSCLECEEFILNGGICDPL